MRPMFRRAFLPFAAALSDIYKQCLAAGLAGEDFAATIKPLEKQAALEVKAAVGAG